MLRFATLCLLTVALAAGVAVAKPPGPVWSPTLDGPAGPVSFADDAPTVVSFTGDGYTADTRILATVTDPDGLLWSAYLQVGTSDGSGNVAFALDLGSRKLGTWTISTYEWRTLKKRVYAATATVEVVAAP
jgi:hypothetical protein